jgi:magnesium-transporting ATPase (P-type)
MSYEDFEALKTENGNFETELGRANLECGFTLVASYGLHDEYRNGCIEAIDKLYKGDTNTRILSGDHHDTVIAAARHFGIIEPEGEFGVISGEELRVQLLDLLTEVQDETNPTKQVMRFKNKEARKLFKDTLNKEVQVLYRATPYDKYLFTSALRDSGSVVAVTGESISDVMALGEADVGFCMGSGCAVAKDASDIIFLDDNFSSIFNAVKWGRNIFENCRKFIMF